MAEGAACNGPNAIEIGHQHALPMTERKLTKCITAHYTYAKCLGSLAWSCYIKAQIYSPRLCAATFPNDVELSSALSSNVGPFGVPRRTRLPPPPSPPPPPAAPELPASSCWSPEEAPIAPLAVPRFCTSSRRVCKRDAAVTGSPRPATSNAASTRERGGCRPWSSRWASWIGLDKGDGTEQRASRRKRSVWRGGEGSARKHRRLNRNQTIGTWIIQETETAAMH